MKKKLDIYQIMTDQIVAKLEEGTVPWHKPWKGGMPQNLVTKKSYRGLNVLILMSRGYSNPYWATYNQVNAAGGYVKKGEKSTPIIFWKIMKSNETDEETGKKKTIPLMRYYNVFNIDQTEGIDPKKMPLLEANDNDTIEACEELVKGFKDAPKVVNGSRAAWFHGQDKVEMPKLEMFDNSEEYYSTLFHEFVHSTESKKRTNRKEKNLAYAEEELVAEIGASFLCSIAGIDVKIIDNSAAYIDTWLKRLTDDKKIIYKMAQLAQAGVDHITKSEKEEL
jgi:antirestriction protein ArdC